MFSTATSDSRLSGGASAIAKRKRAGSAMVVTESAEHEIGGLGAEGERCLARLETRPQLRKGEPDGSRSSVSQPIGRDDDPLGREAKRRRQDCVHAAIGLMRQDIVGWPAPRALRRRGAAQKQVEARAADRPEIVTELGKAGMAPRGVRSAVCHGEAGREPAPRLAVVDVRKARAGAVVVM